MGETYSAKALVPMHQSTRNHISEQVKNKSIKDNTKFKLC